MDDHERLVMKADGATSSAPASTPREPRAADPPGGEAVQDRVEAPQAEVPHPGYGTFVEPRLLLPSDLAVDALAARFLTLAG